MTSSSKNGYIDKLDDIVNQYNEKDNTYIFTLANKLMIKILNFNLVIM